MTVTFANAPLQELVAELRWQTDAPSMLPPQAAGAGFLVGSPSSSIKNEELYMHFAAIAAAKGFGRLERVLPSGFPDIAHQVVCRYRPTDASKASPLYQVGIGVFSANALPPYKSWADFQPAVRDGLEMLKEAHERTGKPMPFFNAAIVKYIDAFKSDLLGELTQLEFINKVLGLKIGLAPSIETACTDISKAAAHVQWSLPVGPGQMTMIVGHGISDGQPSVLMDTTIVIARKIGTDIDAALGALIEARGVIHQLFKEMTAPIHDLMQKIK